MKKILCVVLIVASYCAIGKTFYELSQSQAKEEGEEIGHAVGYQKGYKAGVIKVVDAIGKLEGVQIHTKGIQMLEQFQTTDNCVFIFTEPDAIGINVATNGSLVSNSVFDFAQSRVTSIKKYTPH